MSRVPAPLDGMRVVDISQNLAGPFATQILGDLGADVIKIEPPGGDPARAWGPPFVGGVSPLFLSANRNKRSVVLDLALERDRERLRQLVATADVFVEAFRAGVAARLGFDYDAVRAIRADIVYLSVTAFGEEGPLRDRPGYDPLLQAFGGMMSVTGSADGEPARAGTSVVDLGTGVWAALAVMAKLMERARTGTGGRVTAALLDTTLAWMGYHLQGWYATGEVPRAAGTGLGMIAPYEAFPTSDGRVMIAAANDAIFARLVDTLGLGSLTADARFASNAARVANRASLIALIESATARFETAALVDALARASVPASPIHDVAQVGTHEQVAASGMIRPLEGGPDARYRDIALPARWDGERAPVRRPPPALGEHTAEVLGEMRE